jgi:hypothetical protein
MPQVFKESEYYSENPQSAYQETQSSFPAWETHLFEGIKGLKTDFGEVVEASKKFPIRSALTIIGALTVVYIGFRISKSFVMIKNRLRG